MLKNYQRLISAGLALVLILTIAVSGTFAWQNSQTVKNEVKQVLYTAELHKYERDSSGAETEKPLSDAVFLLFRADDTQVGDVYTTDVNGKITVSLAEGSYYFREQTPPENYEPDTDEEDQPITDYPFTITGGETEPVVVTAYNRLRSSTLTVSKTVHNADGGVVTEEQAQIPFTFTVTFGDGGSYDYTVGGGEPQTLASGGTLQLKHGESAVFTGLPVGLGYTVTEQAVENYDIESSGSSGNITTEGCEAAFCNIYTPVLGGLTVSKTVSSAEGELSEEQENAAFDFVVTFSDGGSYDYTVGDGEPQTLVSGGTLQLKHGESAVFTDIPAGVTYTVSETVGEDAGYVAEVTELSGTILADETAEAAFRNVYQENVGVGGLEVSKTVSNEDGSELSEEQENAAFDFVVTFSDGGSYDYTVGDGEPQTLVSGGTLQLKHGESAVFTDIPADVSYTVSETVGEDAEYVAEVAELSGTILADETAEAAFRNVFAVDDTAEIRVTKNVVGEVPEEDAEKEFAFFIDIDGVVSSFTLKAGESKTFETKIGAVYTVTEQDYSAEQYSTAVDNASGTVRNAVEEVLVANTYAGSIKIEVAGTKTWVLGSHGSEVLPESVTVKLMNGTACVDKAVVKPEAGEWHYAFTAPKYDSLGNEITYHVEEAAVSGFVASYAETGYDIVNTYVEPILIDPPVVVKTVDGDDAPTTRFTFVMVGKSGAPMPEGAEGSTIRVDRDGVGSAEFGTIEFRAAGTYEYTIYEESTANTSGWTYSNVVYKYTVTVTEEDGVLSAEKSLVKVGELEEQAQAEFVNVYNKAAADNVLIRGTKTWVHGSNPEDKQPTSIVVCVYGNGKRAAQRTVTAADKWQYQFELPRCDADGKTITYTVQELAVPNYKVIVKGYDLTNVYFAPKPATPEKTEPGNVNSAGTADNSHIVWWIVIGMSAMAMTAVVLIRGNRKTRKEIENIVCPEEQKKE